MADSTVLREFLISLGFKVEDANKFEKSVEKATETVAKLGTAIEGIAAVATAMVTKVSSKFEDLYYASQRLHSSVANIKAFQYAISQLGGTSQGARQSMEGLAQALRSNPGLSGILTGMGISLQDRHGKLKGADQLLVEFGQHAANMPYYMAQQYAEMLGVDNQTLDALIRNAKEGNKHLNEYREELKKLGVDQDKAAKASAQWAQDFRKLLALVDAWKDKLVLYLQKPFERIVNLLEKLHKATGGWSTGIIALLALLAPLYVILGPVNTIILAIAAGIAFLVANYGDLNTSFLNGINWKEFSGELQQVSQDFNQLIQMVKNFGQEIMKNFNLKDFIRENLQSLHQELQAIIHLAHALDAVKKHDWRGAAAELGAAARSQYQAMVMPGTKETISGGPGALDPSNDPALRGMHDLGANFGRMISKGAVIGQAIQFFSAKGAPAYMIKALLAGMNAESGLNPGAVNRSSGAFGLGQWLGKRKKQLFEMFHTNNPSVLQQLEFMWWELHGGDPGGKAVLSARTTDEALRAFIGKFERPDLPGSHKGFDSDYRNGTDFLNRNAVELNQKTDIHVYGSGDPNLTAGAVAGAQDRVNQNWVRWNKNGAS